MNNSNISSNRSNSRGKNVNFGKRRSLIDHAVKQEEFLNEFGEERLSPTHIKNKIKHRVSFYSFFLRLLFT